MSGGQTEKQAQLIRDFKPDMIMVTPSYCLNLIEELERQMGGDASGCSLRVGVFGAEPWTLRCGRKSSVVWGFRRWISTACRR
jgi:phenylacetate-CoA ligase